MDKCYNQVVAKILKDAESEMMNLKHPYVGTEHLLLSLLKRDKIKKVCYKYNLTYTNFRTCLIKIIGTSSKKSEVILYTPLLKQVIESAYNKSYDNHDNMDDLYLFSALFNETDGIALRIVDNMGVSIKEVTKEINKPVFTTELGINLNEKKSDDKILLREKELDEVMQILLRRNKNNPLLIGKAGVGKTAIVEELARMIKKGCVPEKLKDKQIILINTASLIAGTKYRGEFEERVNNLIKEVINHKNIILFIDEIHNIVKTGASDGSIDAANILKPYLARGDVSIIGATTTSEYNEYIKRDSALTRRFAPVIINEPSLADMKKILSKVKTNFEEHYNLKIPSKTINYLIKECDVYLPNLYNPDKCIDVLDTACSKKTLDNYQNNIKKLIIGEEDIHNIIAARTNLGCFNYEKLELLKEELYIKYNEQIIKNIINIIKDDKPNKYMILNGDEKNKKEDVIKYLANSLNIHLINIDCEDYNDEYSLNKLLGSNYLYDEICEYPFSIIMFNNYNSVGKILHNLINTMIHRGYISNNKNEKVLLNNAIIFLLNNENNSQIGFNHDNKLLFTP
ncbi:MAG: AAA family ATPase [Bacilli bacterium]|nr:AAA family ATPase [Bacilli bacterium]MDD4795744.1 AAA family ATPase [Bacilli bacterium]